MRTSRILSLAAAVVLTATATTASGYAAAAGTPSSSCTSWQLVPTPTPPGLTASLGSVASISASDVMFTGYGAAAQAGLDGPFPVSSPWVLHWNGRSVTEGTQIPADPTRGSGGGDPPDANTVGWISSFDSASDGWAFAPPFQSFASFSDAVAEHWHDGRWTLTPLQTTPQETFPGGVPKGQIVRAAAALSPDDAWAVGELGQGDLGFEEHYDLPDTPLIEHWDGAQWQAAPAAAPALPAGDLFGLAAVSPTDIWAVGAQYVPGNDNDAEPLVEHWDGTVWTTVPAPSAGQGGSYLWAISAASSSDLWAVGAQDGSEPGTSPLVEHWDGNAWTVQQVPDNGEVLTSVAASPGDVWAIGQEPDSLGDGPNEDQYQSVFLHWDGSTWTMVPVPGPHEYGLVEQYTAIAAAGHAGVWAAGSAYDSVNGALDPLIAHLSCQ
jgi:hypothetical protein